MNKIKNLLIKAGCNPKLVDSILESLDNFKSTVKEEFEQEYAAKIQHAKKICIEETEAHNREMARRLQIFCETKSATIEAQLAKRSAINESEAEARLQKLKDLLEGIQPSGSQNGAVAVALERAKKQSKIANESRQKALEAANRHMAVADKALGQNRSLVTENA